MKNIIKLTILSVCLLYMAGCEDMNSLHQEYLDKGETIYTARIDSVESFMGVNKVQFVWTIKADPRIAKTEISWYEGIEKKTRLVDVVRSQNGPVIMDVTIDNLPEGAFYFEFATLDKEGNRSVSIGKTVDIFGDKYIAGLMNKSLQSAFYIGEELIVTWGVLDNATALFTNMYYTNTSNVRTAKKILKGDTKTVITDWKSGFEYETLYVPDPTMIDTFHTNLRTPGVEPYPVVNREINIIARFGNGITVSWADQTGISVEFFYTNLSGQAASKRFDVVDMASSYILDVGVGAINYRTTHKPAATEYVSEQATVAAGIIRDYATYVTTSPEVTTIKPGDFDLGGEGIGFHDSNGSHDPGSGGANYRPSRGDTWSAAMDIEGDGGNIGYSNTGEWLMYTIDVATTGYYEIDWYISVNGTGAACHIEVDGVASDRYDMVNNSNWSDWRYYCQRNVINAPIFHITAGKHTVKYYYDGGNHNYNGLMITYKLDGSQPEPDEPIMLEDAVGYWEFENTSNLTQGIIGAPLVFVEDNKTITSIAGPRVYNKAIRIPRDPKNAGTTGTFVKCLHGIAPKNGQANINEYTVMWDIRLPDEPGLPESSYYSLMSARTLDNTKDQDFAIKQAGSFGIGDLGYSPDGTLTKGKWHRVVLTAKAGVFFRYYVDGAKVYEGNVSHANAVIDGRFSLLPGGVLFFSDEDGDDSTIDAAAIAIWDVALSDSDVATLGSIR